MLGRSDSEGTTIACAWKGEIGNLVHLHCKRYRWYMALAACSLSTSGAEINFTNFCWRSDSRKNKMYKKILCLKKLGEFFIIDSTGCSSKLKCHIKWAPTIQSCNPTYPFISTCFSGPQFTPARCVLGYEMCYVSRETMLPAVVEAVTNYDGKVWIRVGW